MGRSQGYWRAGWEVSLGTVLSLGAIVLSNSPLSFGAVVYYEIMPFPLFMPSFCWWLTCSENMKLQFICDKLSNLNILRSNCFPRSGLALPSLQCGAEYITVVGGSGEVEVFNIWALRDWRHDSLAWFHWAGMVRCGGVVCGRLLQYYSTAAQFPCNKD